MRGKIIVIDNSNPLTKNLIVKENYILAHTGTIQIKSYSPMHARQPGQLADNNN